MSKFVDLESPIAIVSHDAGGAEVLSSYVAKTLDYKYEFVLEGPAVSIFERKLGKLQIQPLQETIEKCKTILCGTSWQSDLEFRAIKFARNFSKPSIAYLDHWVNYVERFTRDNKKVFPDEIWVGDTDAFKLASELFAGPLIKLVENAYFEDIKNEIASHSVSLSSTEAQARVLYVCEPVREHALLQHGDERYWGYVEEEALRYFLNNVDLLGTSIDSITIRPHPSEPDDKYNWVFDEFNMPIEISKQQTLIEQVSKHQVVVGCESMAMVVGLLANKRVISTIPPGGKACSLPQQNIEKLSSMSNAQALSV